MSHKSSIWRVKVVNKIGWKLIGFGSLYGVYVPHSRRLHLVLQWVTMKGKKIMFSLVCYRNSDVFPFSVFMWSIWMISLAIATLLLCIVLALSHSLYPFIFAALFRFASNNCRSLNSFIRENEIRAIFKIAVYCNFIFDIFDSFHNASCFMCSSCSMLLNNKYRSDFIFPGDNGILINCNK